jgi:2-haloacid dehalogenase
VITGCFESFADITQNSLRHALAEYGVEISEDNLRSLMTAYDSLSAFPDVTPTLEQLGSAPNITAVVFSNGTEAMVSNSVHRSASLSHTAKVFHDIVTVDSVAEYKPTPAAYRHLAKRMGKSPSQMHELWLISGNPFDIVGAKSMGMNAIWINRKGGGWVDACLPHLEPTAVVNNLEQIVEVLLNSHGD